MPTYTVQGAFTFEWPLPDMFVSPPIDTNAPWESSYIFTFPGGAQYLWDGTGVLKRLIRTNRRRARRERKRSGKRSGKR